MNGDVDVASLLTPDGTDTQTPDETQTPAETETEAPNATAVQ